MSADDLDAIGFGPLVVQHRGKTTALVEPVELPWKSVVAALSSRAAFAALVAHPLEGLSLRELDAVMHAWSRHHDLPPARELGRLNYLVGKYRRELEYDLRRHLPGTDLGELWRSRQYRLLLNLIDHLPSNSYYAQAALNDEEHTRLLARAQKAAEDAGVEGPKGPPRAWWSEEAEQLAGLRDAVHNLIRVVMQVNGVKQVPRFDPTPRPSTMLPKAKMRERWAEHNKLVARLLPNRQQE